MYVSDKCLVLYNRHRTIRNARRIGNLVSDSSSKRYPHKHIIYTYKHTHTHTHTHTREKRCCTFTYFYLQFAHK